MLYSSTELIGVNFFKVDKEPQFAVPTRTKVYDPANPTDETAEAVYGYNTTAPLPAGTDTCSISEEGSISPIGGTYTSPDIDVAVGEDVWIFGTAIAP